MVAARVAMLAAASLLWSMGCAGLKAPQRDLQSAGSALRATPPDPRIQAALRQISVANIRHTIDTLVSFGTRSTLSSMRTDLPPGQGIAPAARWIREEFERDAAACGDCLQVRLDTFVAGPGERLPVATRITNVFAVLPGSDPAQADRVLLVTGHYDSRNSDVLDGRGPAPGANDDGSGVAVVLECARVLSRLKLPATLVFAAVAGEEQGLYGSRHLAQLAEAQHWRVEGVLDDDIVGGNTTPGDHGQDYSVARVFSEGVPRAATSSQLQTIEQAGYESDSPSRELARALAQVADSYGDRAAPSNADAASAGPVLAVLEFRLDRFLRGGDHQSFNEQGMAAVRLTEWREDFHHQHQNVRTEGGLQYGDLPQFVDFGYVSRVAALNAAALGSFAAAPPPPVDVAILTGGLDNDTTLEWQPGSGSPADTRYQILWRASRAPQWQVATEVHQAARADGSFRVTVAVSKDNVIFGVRAVDAQGHASPAVLPWPRR